MTDHRKRFVTQSKRKLMKTAQDLIADPDGKGPHSYKNPKVL